MPYRSAWVRLLALAVQLVLLVERRPAEAQCVGFRGYRVTNYGQGGGYIRVYAADIEDHPPLLSSLPGGGINPTLRAQLSPITAVFQTQQEVVNLLCPRMTNFRRPPLATFVLLADFDGQTVATDSIFQNSCGNPPGPPIPTCTAPAGGATPSRSPTRTSTRTGSRTATRTPTRTPTGGLSRTPTRTPTGAPAGSCCVEGTGPGCANAACASCVCGADPFCCETEWDTECAAAAQDECPAQCGCSPSRAEISCPSTSLTGQVTEIGGTEYSLGLDGAMSISLRADCSFFTPCDPPLFFELRSSTGVLRCSGSSPVSCPGLPPDDYVVNVSDVGDEEIIYTLVLDCTAGTAATRTPTRTLTRTATRTSTRTATSAPAPPSATPTPSRTPSRTATRTFTHTVALTPSRTPTRTASHTPSRTATPTSTSTPSRTASVTRSRTQTVTRTSTPTFTPTRNPCGDGVLNPGEECDGGEANSDDEPNACRSDCRLPKCGDNVVDDKAPFSESCDDGNTDDGDGCPSDCKLKIELSPRLVLGLGFCGAAPRAIEVRDTSTGRDITKDAGVSFDWIRPGGLAEEIVNDFLAELPISVSVEVAKIVVADGQVQFLSVAEDKILVNVIQAIRTAGTREETRSNYAFVLAGNVLKVTGLKIKPVSAANTFADLLSTPLKEAGITNPPMILFTSGETCAGFDVGAVATTGVAVVEDLTFDFFGGAIKGLDLVKGITAAIKLGGRAAALIAAAKTGSERVGRILVWLADAISRPTAQVTAAQLLDFEVSTKASEDKDGEEERVAEGEGDEEEPVTEDEVIRVTDELSLIPPVPKGTVFAKAPGISAVQATFKMECVGEASDLMLVVVAPRLEGVQIRNSEGKPEDPIELSAGERHAAHAVGMFNVAEGSRPIKFDKLNLARAVSSLVSFGLPGTETGIEFDGSELRVTWPPGSTLTEGLYGGGNYFFRTGITFAPKDDFFTVTELRFQTPLPQLPAVPAIGQPAISIADWRLLDPLSPAVEMTAASSDWRSGVTLTGRNPGSNDVEMDACVPFSVGPPENLKDRVHIAVDACAPRIDGTKFHDRDGDGSQGPGEPGLDGWTIELREAAGNLLRTATTMALDGADGRYDFGRVRLDPAWGEITLREVPQNGWVPSALGGDRFSFDIDTLINRLDCPDRIGADFGNRTYLDVSRTPTVTPTSSPTMSATLTATRTPTRTSSRTPTRTSTQTPTNTPHRPAITGITPDHASHGTYDLEITIKGANFKPGAALTFQPGSWIRIIPPRPPNYGFEGPTELRHRIDIAPEAEIGPRQVFVTNLDGAAGGVIPFNRFFVTTADPGPCAGDCDGNLEVSEEEVGVGLNIPFDPELMRMCPQFDRNRDGRMSAAELVAAMNDRIVGCRPEE